MARAEWGAPVRVEEGETILRLLR